MSKTNSTPLISVIVPVYNVANYLKTCVKSICNQTYSNLEIILIDDGSSDNSEDICDELAQNDTRIKVVHTQNQGLSAARNTGINLCTGEYIAFVDSDDAIHPQMYDLMLNIMLTHSLNLLVCNYQNFSTDEELENFSNTPNSCITENEAKPKIFSGESLVETFSTEPHGESFSTLTSGESFSTLTSGESFSTVTPGESFSTLTSGESFSTVTPDESFSTLTSGESFSTVTPVEIFTSESYFEAMYENTNENYIPFIVAWNKLYSRELFNNIRYPEGKIHEDNYVICPIIGQSKKTGFYNKPLYAYRTREHSIMTSSFSVRRLDKFEGLTHTLQYAKQLNFKEKILKYIAQDCLKTGIDYALQVCSKSDLKIKDLKKYNQAIKSTYYNEKKLLNKKLKLMSISYIYCPTLLLWIYTLYKKIK